MLGADRKYATIIIIAHFAKNVNNKREPYILKCDIIGVLVTIEKMIDIPS